MNCFLHASQDCFRKQGSLRVGPTVDLDTFMAKVSPLPPRIEHRFYRYLLSVTLHWRYLVAFKATAHHSVEI